MKTLSLMSKLVLLVCFALGPFLSYAEDSIEKTPAISVETGKININTATVNMLAETLKGVGLKKATAIIEYRKTYGPFSNIQELADVAGIGPSTLEKNAHLIAVN